MRGERRKNRVGATCWPWHRCLVNDYERVALIIRYLDEHHVEQPDLAALAQRAGLSSFHFHRLFSKWAGVTPKDFLQCLTAAHAKQLLREGGSVLDAALNAGLSGPGRLHDLCINLEAASPGELKSGGLGCEIRYGLALTPFGVWLAAEMYRGVCHLSFVDDGESADAVAALRNEWPNAHLIRDDAAARKLSSLIFAEPTREHLPRTLSAFVRGTPFQLRVWRALLHVPAGALVTYGQLAAASGSPTAARAVGNAVGSNPLAFLIPCHRVIRETGVVGNYRWGQTRKRSMLAWESAARRRVASECA
jgi:AraC family transcriptional regulator, regulatory protein of adaptative response / methylated-DNA-[protein]-cysteine methyltransferase